MTKGKLSRRQVLRGLGGVAVALPFLPSLLDSKAAEAATMGQPRRFLALRSEHGGVLGSNMYPADATLTDGVNYAGYTVRRGDLAVDGSGGLSPVLTASALTPGLAAKMNVLRGLDLGFYIAHHRGGSLGNYGDSTDNERELKPTCDQLLAWSPKFYSDLSTILMRSMVIGDGGMSWNHTNPQDVNSPIEKLHAENSSKELFKQIYNDPGPQQEKRKPIIDRVMEDYKRLRNSNRRLSALDKQRLDDHIARLDEIDRRLNVQVSCNDITPPTKGSLELLQGGLYRDIVKHTEFWQLLNDVVVAALSCDTSRVVTLCIGDLWDSGASGWFSDTTLEWHQEVAHKSHQPDRQALMVAAQQGIFEHVFLDLAAKLDAVQDVNGTLLDSCLMFWTQESGSYTHDPIELPVVTAGGAGGWLKTGNYADYRNSAVTAHDGNGDPSSEKTHAGLLYNQWLGTAMQAMGLSPADYESIPGGGYGLQFWATETWYAGYKKYTQEVIDSAGDPLPFLKA